jgi:hypothetical protein
MGAQRRAFVALREGEATSKSRGTEENEEIVAFLDKTCALKCRPPIRARP